MNVLIVSQNFIKGGLETQISSTVDSLKNKINFYFAFSKYNSNLLSENIYTDFYFSDSSSISEFCEDVDRLIKIIKDNNIDIVHAHPFFSLFPAVFAAKLCKIPIVYTYHGIGSFNFTGGIIDSLLFNMLMDYEIDKIFSVSLEGKQIMENIVLQKDKVTLLPNLIDTNKFCKAKIINNKSWALISRLDTDKIDAIVKIITSLNNLDIEELHIFGDGNEIENLKTLVTNNNLKNKVFFEGYKDNLFEQLNGKFNGVIGIGRVVMESIAMQFPTILIGFNKIAGVVDTDIYNVLKNQNFINKYIPSIDENILNKQLQQVYNDDYDKTFYSTFKDELSAQKLSLIYYNELKNTYNQSLLNLEEIYSEIKNISSKDCFYSNINIYNILRKYFSFFARQFSQKNLLILGDNLLLQQNINDQIMNKLQAQRRISDENRKQIETLKNKIYSLSQDTMTYKNFKRKLMYKLNKRKNNRGLNEQRKNLRF